MSDTIRLAMLGMIPGNGHPYSWSAIINGYHPGEMARCPYPAIPGYLDAQGDITSQIHGVKITHLWTDNPAEAPHVAAASLIPNIVADPKDVIGQVDAVIIATDDGADHVRRARPFVEAGLPVFIDKPLATTRAELAQFVSWKRQGAKILSSSGMRYAPEISPLAGQRWSWITSVTCKTWERYGIHALEPMHLLLGPGFTSARTDSQPGSDIVYAQHRSGAQVTCAAIHEATGSFGAIHAYGAHGDRAIKMTDTYRAFRSQLIAVADWLRSGADPYPFTDTVEMMGIIIAGIESRARGGETVTLDSIISNL